MTSLFFRILKQARRTFDKHSVESFKSEFTVLKQLIDQLTLEDLSLNPELVTRSAFHHIDKAPCKFIHIFEDEIFTMSVFILDGDYTMPLHDHPMMHGILKGIAGKLRIHSYTAVEVVDSILPRKINVRAEPVKDISSSAQSAILTHKVSNYHEITAVGGPAAFFDVLSPPYDSAVYGKRTCSFYRKIEQGEIIILERIPTPTHYFCDTEVSPEIINQITSDFS